MFVGSILEKKKIFVHVMDIFVAFFQVPIHEIYEPH
jgi:hypothetical protein